MFDHPEFAEHENVVFCHDPETGLNAIIAIHNSRLGPALGGVRMYPYASSAEALYDVLRLSKGMTYKAAMANLPQGGGKAVIIGDPKADKTEARMHAMGRFVANLHGQYVAAQDSGMSVGDLHQINAVCEHLVGVKAKYSVDGKTPDGNPSPATAYGAYCGLKASVAYQLDSDLKGVRVALQGLGQVGYRLGQYLHAAGAELWVTDVNQDQLRRAQDELNAIVVSPDEITAVEAEVFAPCALGGAINAESIEQLKVKVVAGAANNQLHTEAMGTALQERGILYAPDYVINGGGIIDLYHQTIDSSEAKMKQHLESIGETLVTIYDEARQSHAATNVVANRIAERRFGG